MRRILGWSLLAVVISDILFTYFDNKLSAPPTPVTLWIMDTTWRVPVIIAVWIAAVFASVVLINRS